MEQAFSDQLNPTQLEAVHSLQGPLLILAGAGSGKTRVLTYRVANLILQGEASPDQILAVTFTNKAAREMESRTLKLLMDMNVPVYDQMWITTFHSGCARILREHIQLLDYQPFFVIYDDSDQLSLIKKCLTALNINDKIHPAKGFKSRINEAKMLGLHPDEVERKAHYLMDEKAIAVYELYEREMKKANALDFGDLLLKTYDLFKMYPNVLEEYQDKFRFIMVDEYQDTNRIQYLIVQLLAAKHKNLCVVGDEDQSIYSWRGADIQNILSFEEDFSECKTVKLEENYRSTRNIVEAASHMIKNNSQRKEKTLFSNQDEGSLITVQECANEYDEAKFVVRKISSYLAQGEWSCQDFSIFYRTNAQSRVLEDELRSHSIPYRLVGGLKFYDRKEVKDVLSYMRLALNPADDVAFKRVINVPARGIGKTTVEKIEGYATQHGITMFEACVEVAANRLVHSGASKKLQNFRFMMDGIVQEAKESKVSDVYIKILESTQYIEKLRTENTTESLARIDNLEEFNNAIHQFEKERDEEASLQSFLEEMALISDADSVREDEAAVTLMTLHVSKGLEYSNVFIVGNEDGLFPGGRALGEGDPDAIEEERRLFYVGMTRAEKNLFLTHARTRRVWGQEQNHPPSRFLREIPSQYLNQVTRVSRPQFLNRYEDEYGSDSSNGFSSNGNGYKRKTIRRKPAQQESYSSDPFPDYENESNEENGSAYQKGQRVRHPTFGVGSIYKVEGQGEQQKVSVLFQDKTSKKFVVKYARLERV